MGYLIFAFVMGLVSGWVFREDSFVTFFILGIIIAPIIMVMILFKSLMWIDDVARKI